MTEQLKQAREFITSYGISGTLADGLQADEIAAVEMTLRELLDRAIEQPPITVEELRGMRRHEVILEDWFWNEALDAVIEKIEGK